MVRSFNPSLDDSACSTVCRRNAGNRLLFRNGAVARMRPTCSRTSSLSAALTGCQGEPADTGSTWGGADGDGTAISLVPHREPTDGEFRRIGARRYRRLSLHLPVIARNYLIRKGFHAPFRSDTVNRFRRRQPSPIVARRRRTPARLGRPWRRTRVAQTVARARRSSLSPARHTHLRRRHDRTAPVGNPRGNGAGLA